MEPHFRKRFVFYLVHTRDVTVRFYDPLIALLSNRKGKEESCYASRGFDSNFSWY